MNAIFKFECTVYDPVKFTPTKVIICVDSINYDTKQIIIYPENNPSNAITMSFDLFNRNYLQSNCKLVGS